MDLSRDSLLLPAFLQLPTTPDSHTLMFTAPHALWEQWLCGPHSSSSSLGPSCLLLPLAQRSKLSPGEHSPFLVLYWWWRLGDSWEMHVWENGGGALLLWLWPVGTAFWHSCFHLTCMFPLRRWYKEWLGYLGSQNVYVNVVQKYRLNKDLSRLGLNALISTNQIPNDLLKQPISNCVPSIVCISVSSWWFTQVVYSGSGNRCTKSAM